MLDLKAFHVISWRLVTHASCLYTDCVRWSCDAASLDTSAVVPAWRERKAALALRWERAEADSCDLDAKEYQ